MRVGFVGLGKLGLPVALAMEYYGGHDVVGYDISDVVCENIRNRHIPYREAGAQELLDRSGIRVAPLDEVIAHGEIIFVPVQTPHEPRYEGVTRLPAERVDFDYSWLVSAMESVSESIVRQGVDPVVAIVSTVLPGTIEREVLPKIDERIRICYNPSLIAMGTTIEDFIRPEMVILGGDDLEARAKLAAFYGTISPAPVMEMSIASAELTKVSYNTAISAKIMIATTIMEICEKTDADCDEVTNALSMATTRILSPKYMRGGMGDAGGCHPRDCIALSHLAQRLDLSHDIYETLMQQREYNTEWLAELMWDAMDRTAFPGVVLGRAYKKETNLTVGSCATLLVNLLHEHGVEVEQYDPWVDDGDAPLDDPAVFFIATNHEEFLEYDFPAGSIVIDPWGYIPDQPGVLIRRIGRKSQQGEQVSARGRHIL